MIQNDFFSEEYSAIELLPQNASAMVRDTKMRLEIISLYHGMISFLIESLYNFYIDKQYHFFDPHVGETACQIRAGLYLFMINKKINTQVILDRIFFLKELIKQIIAAANNVVMHKNNSESIEDIITNNNLDFKISHDEIFLCTSYILTIFKDMINRDIYVSSDRLSAKLKISKKLSKKIIYKFQKIISFTSCLFINFICQKNKHNIYNQINLTKMIKIDDNSRFVYPCFLYSRYIFEYIAYLNISILVKYNKIDGEIIFYKTINSKGSFINKLDEHINYNKECLVVHCCRKSTYLSSIDLLNNLDSFGIHNILLMNMAAHPQFSGERLSVFANQLFPENHKLTLLEKEINNDFLNFRDNAKIYGFCKENPELLLVEHIFFDKIENQIASSYNESVYIGELEAS